MVLPGASFDKIHVIDTGWDQMNIEFTNVYPEPEDLVWERNWGQLGTSQERRCGRQEPGGGKFESTSIIHSIDRPYKKFCLGFAQLPCWGGAEPSSSFLLPMSLEEHLSYEDHSCPWARRSTWATRTTLAQELGGALDLWGSLMSQ